MSDNKTDTSQPTNVDAGPSTIRQPLDHIDDVNIFSQKTLKSILEATKSSNGLPTGDDFDFYSTFRSVRDVLDIESQRILSLIDGVLNQQCVKGKLSRGSATVEIEDKFDVLTEANDNILERIGTNLDEASGIKKAGASLVVSSVSSTRGPVSTSWNRKKVNQDSPTSFRLLAAKNTPRPQFKFQDKIDNSDNPFVPKIKNKPNAIVTLEESLKISDVTERVEFPHPYQAELEQFQPQECQLVLQDPQQPCPIEETPLRYVDTVKDLKNVLSKLKQVKEIAIDLEAHSYRTYQGITCLMQISTRSEDFIIDCISLRSELAMLNEVFTDDKILKVLHGGDADVLWLQRDHGLYIVNMFDTGQAARVLNLERLSLAHLLDIYCHVEAQKQYQLADWRIRPLPQELIEYARSDTHYLLYIYDKLRNELIQNGNDQNNLLYSVYNRSKQLCLKTYTKLVVTDETHLELYRKSRKVFDSQQLASLKQLYTWRDNIARQEDESTGYVLPNHMLLQIASILPREKQGILACCNPIPPIVRQYINEIHTIIQDARSVPVVKKETKKPKASNEIQIPTYGDNTSIYCPHDLSKTDHTDLSTELITNLSTSTGSMFPSSKIKLVTTKSLISAFSLVDDNNYSDAKRKAAEIKSKLEQPFDMFLPGIECKNTKTWILKPSTIPAPKESNSMPEYVPPSKRKRPTEDNVPFRNQIWQEKKQKLEVKNEDSTSSNTKFEAKVKKVKKDKSHLTDNFKPFDYSSVDRSIFESKFSTSKFEKKKKFKKH